MCGICGIYNYGDRENSVNQDLVIRMTNAVQHRGPDDSGYYFRNIIGLGHRRLSIIDLQGGHQPIHNEDKTVWIIFNGEIYNFQTLRSDLINKGHKFYTRSDTETIVHLYEEFGEACVEKIRGMFAFALWDEKRQKLILVRDRVGIKPLFYRNYNGSIAFGSELKCLLQDTDYSKEIDLEALDHFLSFSYVPAPHCIFRGIKKLMPGNMLIVENSRIKTKRYWQLTFNPDLTNGTAYFKGRINDLLHEAIKLRLISEVPLGAFLSGGIDSTTVVAMMSEAMDEPVNTLSIGYSTGEDYFNELPYARITAKKYGTNHREFIVTPEVDSVIFDIIKSFDEPFADSSIIPSWYICKMASEHVTVALSGLGGDELFGGYERYLGGLMAEYYRKLPILLNKKLIPKIINSIPELKNGNPFFARLKRFVAGASHPAHLRYYSYMSSFNEFQKQRLYTDELKDMLQPELGENLVSSYFNSENANDLLAKMSFVDINVYLPDDILALTDRLSMAHSLEVRVPFLDHILMEFAATVPSDLKIKHFTKKYILNKAVSQKIPKAIQNRKKIGFASPFVLWFRNDLKEYVESYLSKDVIEKRGYFNPDVIKKILDEHFSRHANYQRQILSLLTFEIWHREYLDT